MAIDLRKNKDSLLKAYNDVVADNNSIDWYWVLDLYLEYRQSENLAVCEDAYDSNLWMIVSALPHT